MRNVAALSRTAPPPPPVGPMRVIRHEHYFIETEFRGSGYAVYVAPSLTPGRYHVAVYRGGDSENGEGALERFISERTTGLPPRTPEEAYAWAVAEEEAR